MDKRILSAGFNRRDFLRASALGAAGVAAGQMVPLSAFAHAQGSETIRIGLVGAGGRGTGAASDAVKGSPGVEIVAIGDALVLARRLAELYKTIGR